VKEAKTSKNKRGDWKALRQLEKEVVGELLNEKGVGREKGRWRLEQHITKREKCKRSQYKRKVVRKKKKVIVGGGKKRVIEGCDNSLETKPLMKFLKAPTIK
jgi:hypothetical protein